MVGPLGPDDTRSPRTTPEREWAHKRLEKKRKLRADLVAYVVINAFLIVVWALTGAGYFWPGWVLGGWGVFLLLDAWQAYFRRPITEEDIDRELRGMR
ncbi:2TM domain-containing protein [Streptomyces sp. NPDC000348]|uniref:2TM domain-containing protein n=1 Tax=Streptomyces sp. NPDC000348 TaxID=3364538 RepID=UPI0036C3F4D8